MLAIAFSLPGRLLATTSGDSQTKVWDAASLAPGWRARRSEDSSIRLSLKVNLHGHRGE